MPAKANLRGVRKLPALAVLLMMVAAGAAASASPPAVDRSAFAFWSTGRTKDGHYRIAAASIWITESPTEGSEKAWFSLFRGVCSKEPEEPCLIFLDGPSGRAKPGEVVVDSLMQSAHLKVTRRGQTHEIAWRADGEPRPDAYETLCGNDQSGVGAGSAQSAIAEGRVFGHEVGEESDLHAAAMAIGARVCPNDLP